jgi:hypothetical protein
MESLVNGNSGSQQVVKAFIGAVRLGNGWQAIKAEQANGNNVQRRMLIGAFSEDSRIATFQKAIINQWKGFTGAKAADFAKGKSIGKSMTSASFVAKALKTGFDAIGEPMNACKGLKLRDWSINDLGHYATKRMRPHSDAALIAYGFDRCAPNPAYEDASYTKDPASVSGQDHRHLKYIHSARTFGHSGRFAYADDLKNLPKGFERVITYGFRGETRPPVKIKDAGGFLPNYTRQDHIDKHENSSGLNWAVDEFAALNLQKFIDKQFLGGFISTTKSIAVAKGFALGLTTDHPQTMDGWVYACFVEGGIHLPPLGGHQWVKYAEQEISMPGNLDWEDVVACRRVSKVEPHPFVGPLYIKTTFPDQDRNAYREIYDLLSGKSQGPLPSNGS